MVTEMVGRNVFNLLATTNYVAIVVERNVVSNEAV